MQTRFPAGRPLSSPGGGFAPIIASLAGCLFAMPPARAQNPVWTGAAATNLWSDAGNWSLGRAPVNGDNLFFGANARTANVDNLLLLTVGALTFNAGAPAFQLTISGGAGEKTLTLSGAGFANQSGSAQTVTIAAGLPDPTGMESDGALLRLTGSASAGNVMLVNQGGADSFAVGGQTEFFDNATAGLATIVNEAGVLGNSGPGQTSFFGKASAGQAAIFNRAGSGNTGGGTTSFDGGSTAGSSVILSEGGTGSEFQYGGRIYFGPNATAGNSSITTNGAVSGPGLYAYTTLRGVSTAGSATLTVNGGASAGAQGGQQVFNDLSTAATATIITNGGTNGGLGGRTWFISQSSGGTARAIINAGGVFDVSGLGSPGMPIGSIEGDGSVSLGSKHLSVGGNNLSTTFGGILADGGVFGGAGGGLVKNGSGTFTLSGVKTYTGTTNVNAGTLRVNGSLAAGPVSVVSGATLGGAGTTGRAVTIADGGILAPGTASPGTFTLGSLALNPTSNLSFRFGAPGVVGGASNDLLSISGSLQLDGILNVTNSGGFGNGTYRLLNYNGVLTDNGLSLGSLPAGFNFTIQTSVANQVNLIVSAGGGAGGTTWTGAGATKLWSDAGNWSGGVPTNGANVLFSVSGGGDSINNLALSLASLRFDAAVVPAHDIHIAGGASLSLTGAGIDNDGVFVPGGVLRQQFFADAGGTMTIQNTATVGGRLGVELNALGGTVVGGSGGRIVLMGNSRVFTVVRAHGATVAGASGGELLFQDDAAMGPSAVFTVQGGGVAGAAGGTVIFQGRSKASGNTVNFTGTGLGGRVIFRGNAVAVGISLNNDGAVHPGAGAEAVTQFLDDAVLNGTAVNSAGIGAGSVGGRMEFRDRSRFDGTPVVGSLSILNRGAATAGAESGHTVFYDDTRAVGANTLIRNETESEGSFPGLGRHGHDHESRRRGRGGHRRIDTVLQRDDRQRRDADRRRWHEWRTRRDDRFQQHEQRWHGTRDLQPRQRA